MQQLTQSFFSQNCLCICRTTDYGRLFQGGIEVDREKGIRYLTKQCYIRLSQIYRLVIHCIKLECFIVIRKFMLKVIILSPGFFGFFFIFQSLSLTREYIMVLISIAGIFLKIHTQDIF